jgi:hypothetical protein
MEATQWAESCRRFEALWPTRRISTETVAAWFEEFGVWADYPVAMRALSRLSTESERPPSLAAWREMHGALFREKQAERKRDEGEVVDDGPGTASWERRRRLGEEWLEINDCLHDEPLAAMFRALLDQCRTPGEPTDREADLARQALVDEIRARMIPRRPRGGLRPDAATGPRKSRKGELTRVGDD